ncbi:hypothetical protein GMORB2_4354 [Geosmithia morbida]|uniref:Uncharacterized protein n=1 Tax=Geosmithia morbida TaxID=1094350 RepID=A0A9P4Z152_9HYPO|nr:uncharacterized protein GMORB2_4354 [Geosmithia morbida]KAF4125514.1 hypothetical protein GMORB2_4354 [Geosmithia morbida]
MKFTILSMVTLAVSAAASPLVARAAPTSIDEALEQVNGLVSGGDLVTLLEGALNSIQGHTGAINSTLSQVNSNAISQEDGSSQLAAPIDGLKSDLTKLVSGLNANPTSGITASQDEVTQVVSLVKALLVELVNTAKSIASAPGQAAPLTALLDSVFALLASILSTLVGLLDVVASPLVDLLTSIVPSLKDGDILPLVSPVLGLITSLFRGH